MFVSRKDGKLYVRQAMQPLFDLPVTIRNPEQPLGTHVYTAMGLRDGAMRWTVLSVPSGFPRKQARASFQIQRARRNDGHSPLSRGAVRD